MPTLGRVVIDDTGVIVGADSDFLATIRLTEAALIGRNLLDFTAPADRERCIFLLDRLMGDGEPVSTIKRLVREDGTHVWICNRLSLTDPVEGAARIAIDVDSAPAPQDWVDPAVLLHVARLLVDGRAARSASFSPALFTDPAWDILLAAYVCEAEGSVFSIEHLHRAVSVGTANAMRWVRALQGEGLIEIEPGETSFHLTATAHQKFEQFLSDRHRHAMTQAFGAALRV